MEHNLPPSHRLYSPAQVAVPSFLGSIAAGFWLVSRNHVLLGNAPAAKRAIVWGAVSIAVLIGLALVLPERVPTGPLVIASVLGMQYFTKTEQGKDIELHQRNGGRLASWWMVVGISLVLLFIVVFLGAVAGLLYVLVTEPETLRELFA